MAKKREIMSIFSVVTNISTHGDTLKHRASTLWKHFLDAKDHKDCEYILQIAIADVNKGHIVDFPKFSTEKNDIFSMKKIIEKFEMFLGRWFGFVLKCVKIIPSQIRNGRHKYIFTFCISKITFPEFLWVPKGLIEY